MAILTPTATPCFSFTLKYGITLPIFDIPPITAFVSVPDPITVAFSVPLLPPISFSVALPPLPNISSGTIQIPLPQLPPPLPSFHAEIIFSGGMPTSVNGQLGGALINVPCCSFTIPLAQLGVAIPFPIPIGPILMALQALINQSLPLLPFLSTPQCQF